MNLNFSYNPWGLMGFVLGYRCGNRNGNENHFLLSVFLLFFYLFPPPPAITCLYLEADKPFSYRLTCDLFLDSVVVSLIE